jgi:hypothetical protein
MIKYRVFEIGAYIFAVSSVGLMARLEKFIYLLIQNVMRYEKHEKFSETSWKCRN